MYIALQRIWGQGRPNSRTCRSYASGWPLRGGYLLFVGALGACTWMIELYEVACLINRGYTSCCNNAEACPTKRTACMATHAPEGERGIYNLPCCSNAKGVVEKRTIYVGLTQ